MSLSEYSDWIESTKSRRVWLETSMTALGQFAYVNPLHRVVHWDKKNGKRTKCWEEDDRNCFYCDKGLHRIHEYTYGLYVSPKDKDIRYLSTNITTHTVFQKLFSGIIRDDKNPCGILFKVKRELISVVGGEKVNGYSLNTIDEEAFVPEIDRPSFQAKGELLVPQEIIDGLRPYDNHAFNLLDLFFKMKKMFPYLDEKDIKQYAIKLYDNGVLDLRKGLK